MKRFICTNCGDISYSSADTGEPCGKCGAPVLSGQTQPPIALTAAKTIFERRGGTQG
jgi:hypothetical protein